MKRTPIKTVSNEPEEFIPEKYRENDPKAEDIFERPLIFVGRKLTRDQSYDIQDEIEVIYKVKDNQESDSKADVETSKIKGMGRAYKYVFDKCISEIKNVILDDGGEIKTFDSLKGQDKMKFWDTAGVDDEITEAVVHFMNKSKLEESEAKN